MPGLVPGIHDLGAAHKAWMAGTSPAMTTVETGVPDGQRHTR